MERPRPGIGFPRGTAFALTATLIAAGGGCGGVPASGRQQLIDAEQHYRANEYAKATTILNDYLKAYPDAEASAEGYYLRALCSVRQSNKATAQADVQRCLALSKDAVLTAKAHATAGQLLFESGSTAAACSHYAQALEKLPEAPSTGIARYRYATCLMREGRWSDARQQFAVVIQRYPETGVADQARRVQEWPIDAFSIQCGTFRDAPNADAMVARLRGAGLSARTESLTRGGESVRVVLVGKYATMESARAAVTEVRRHVSDALVVP